MMKWTKQRLNNLFFLCGIVAIVGMLLSFDVSFSELWQHIRRAGYWLVAVICLWVFVYGINAMAWRCLIRGTVEDGKLPVSFLRILRLTITGYALNYATPIGGLGGEPYRIMELQRDLSTEQASSSVIMYAMMHIYSHFWFWFVSIWFFILLAWAGDVCLSVGMWVLLLAVMAFCLLAFWLFAKGYRSGIAVKGIRWTGKIPGLKGWSERFMATHSSTLYNIDNLIATLHRQDKRLFYSSLILEYLARVMQSGEVFFILLMFGIDNGGGLDGYLLTFLHSMLILAFTSLVANLVGFLPLQLGVQEGGFVLSIASLGMSPAIGIFVGIISRVREIVWIMAGLALMKVK